MMKTFSTAPFCTSITRRAGFMRFLFGICCYPFYTGGADGTRE
jgi:hypothetical protein